MPNAQQPAPLAAIVAGFLLIAASSSLFAADRRTPANEGICDPLTDATPGLYGLCVAYCEAINLPEDLSDPTALESLAIQGQKLLRNYDRKKTEDDPDMPCVVYDAINCPAWTYEQAQGVGEHGYPHFYNDLTSGDEDHLLILDLEEGVHPETGQEGTVAIVALKSSSELLSGVAVYFHSIGDGHPEEINRQLILREQDPEGRIAQACWDDVVDNVQSTSSRLP